MGDANEPPDERARRQLERLILFSDAVFAIAITLLVLDLKAPILTARNRGLMYPDDQLSRGALAQRLERGRIDAPARAR